MDEEQPASVKEPSLAEKLEAINAKLREQGHTLESLLARAAHQMFGVEIK